MKVNKDKSTAIHHERHLVLIHKKVRLDFFQKPGLTKGLFQSYCDLELHLIYETD